MALENIHADKKKVRPKRPLLAKSPFHSWAEGYTGVRMERQASSNDCDTVERS